MTRPLPHPPASLSKGVEGRARRVLTPPICPRSRRRPTVPAVSTGACPIRRAAAACCCANARATPRCPDPQRWPSSLSPPADVALNPARLLARRHGRRRHARGAGLRRRQGRARPGARRPLGRRLHPVLPARRDRRALPLAHARGRRRAPPDAQQHLVLPDRRDGLHPPAVGARPRRRVLQGRSRRASSLFPSLPPAVLLAPIPADTTVPSSAFLAQRARSAASSISSRPRTASSKTSASRSRAPSASSSPTARATSSRCFGASCRWPS